LLDSLGLTVDASSLARPAKRAERAAATRQRLIDAAMGLFAEQGYAASSVAAIGERAGVSRGLVNFHFATKENLPHAVIEQLVAELEQQMFPADPPADPLDALAVLVEAHRRFLTDQPERARLLFRLQAEALNPALGLTAFAELHGRWLDRTKPWWEQALSEQQIDPTLDHNAVAPPPPGGWLIGMARLAAEVVAEEVAQRSTPGAKSREADELTTVGQRHRPAASDRFEHQCEGFHPCLLRGVGMRGRSVGSF
jgi:AcrR family transcriptional regulator